MSTNDGGPAFPTEQGHILDGTWNQTYESGMSLRDYFAGQAMIGLVAGITKFRDEEGMEDIIVNRPNDVSQLAYTYADAMLAARNNTTQQETAHARS